MPEPKPSLQTIEDLRKRYENLNSQKIKAGANYDHARDQLNNLKETARKDYGTDDLELLQKRLAEMQVENERKRQEYQAHLDKIESDLKEVDRKFSQVQAVK